jgi:hypothetical protein
MAFLTRPSSNSRLRFVDEQEADMKSNNHTTKLEPSSLRILGLSMFLAGSIGVSACADQIPSAVKSCPCATGNICCESGVCARDADSCGAATQALSESVTGTWVGYLENFPYGDDDSIRISIAVDPAGTLSGQVTLGRATPPAPTVDPSLPWPVDYDVQKAEVLPAYVAGFEHTARNIRWEAKRLRFSIARYEPWQPWCAGQQSHELSPGNFSCLPSDTITGDGAGYCFGCLPADPLTAVRDCRIPINCSIVSLCQTPVCSCDANGCNAQPDEGYSFDIALKDGVGDGSTSLAGNIRLSQSKH